MKIRCEIIAVETNGESLLITLQGKGKSDAEWRPLTQQKICIATTASKQKHFHIGRMVDIGVVPK